MNEITRPGAASSTKSPQTYGARRLYWQGFLAGWRRGKGRHDPMRRDGAVPVEREQARAGRDSAGGPDVLGALHAYT